MKSRIVKGKNHVLTPAPMWEGLTVEMQSFFQTWTKDSIESPYALSPQEILDMSN